MSSVSEMPVTKVKQTLSESENQINIIGLSPFLFSPPVPFDTPAGI